MQFSTNFSAGNIPNTLRIMVSNDFQPEYLLNNATTAGNINVSSARYNKADVEAATWTDITNRFDLPGNQLTTGAQVSGEAVIGEFHHDLPLFIGLRFDADKASDASLSLGQWVFSNFQIRKVFEDGTDEFYINNVLDANWRRLDFADYTVCSVSGNAITLNGNTSTNIQDEEGNVTVIPTVTVKTMVISRPYYPSRVVPDKGLTIKTIRENLTEYTYTYVAPATESVQAAFVATNSLYGDDIREVKKLEVVFR